MDSCESSRIYVDATYKSLNKYTEELCGDRVEIVKNDDYFIVVLSDGLGSGVKANILSTLTSKIISTMMYEGASIEDTVDTIVHTLPVCSVRKVAYSTFCILQIAYDGSVYLVEFDSPGCVFVRNETLQKIEYTERTVAGKKIKESRFKVQPDDVLTIMSDGVVYAGIGALMNLGWTWKNVSEYLANKAVKGISSARVTQMLTETCNQLYMDKPGDDTTVASVKITDKMEVSLLSGPPMDKVNDSRYVTDFMQPEGKKIVCGGSSASIVSRILNEELVTTIDYVDPSIPPVAYINGIDLVTEGVITLKKVLEILKMYLEHPADKATMDEIDKQHGAGKIAKIMLEECTHLHLFIGTKINPAHNIPNSSVDISIKLIILDEIYEVMKKIGKNVTKVYY